MIPKLNKYHEHSRAKINFAVVPNQVFDIPKFSHKLEFNDSIFIEYDHDIIDKFIYHSSSWCYNNLGYRSDLEQTPEIDWSINNAEMQKSNVLGYYHQDLNIIEVRVMGHRTWVNLANTIIHEWVHYLQSNLWYNRYNNSHNYEKNPYELMAYHYAAVNCNKCANFCWRKINNA